MNADSTVRIVGDNADAEVSVVGGQVIEATPGDAGEFVVVNGDGTLGLAPGGSGGPPSGAAGGVLGGTYPNPGFAVDMATQAELDGKVALTGNETVAGVKTFSSDPLVPDEAYGAGWNGSLEPPTKNAVYDKIETVGGAEPVYLSRPTDGATRSSTTLGSLSTPWTDSITLTAGLPAVEYTVDVSAVGGDDSLLYVGLARDGVLVDRAIAYEAGAGQRRNRGRLAGIDSPGAGTYTYEVYVAFNSGAQVTVSAVTNTSTAASTTAAGISSMQLRRVATT